MAQQSSAPEDSAQGMKVLPRGTNISILDVLGDEA
jgi:hypothetical protein